MSEEKETILIDVQLNTDELVNETANAIKALADLKTEQAALNKTIKEGGTLTDEQKARYAELGKQIEDVKTTIKSNTAILQENAKSTKESNGSLNEMRQRLKEAQAAYAALSKEQREGEIGKKAQEDIRALSDEVKSIESALGDNRRNVGNYGEALEGLEGQVSSIGKVLETFKTGGLAGAAKGTQGLTGVIKGGAIPAVKAFAKTLLSTPLGWIAAAVAAVIAVLSKLKEAVKKNDDAGTAFAKLGATFKPIIDGISKALDTVIGWLGKAADALANFLGGMSDAAKEAQDLVTAMDDLEEAERQYVVNNAKRNKEIAELRDKAVQKDKYTAEERKKFLEDAIALQEKDLKDQVDIANEKLRVLETTAKNESDTSDETKNKIAEARAAAINAEAEYYNRKKELTSQLVAFDQEIQYAEAQRTKELQEQVKKRAEARRKEIEETRTLTRELEDAIIANIQDGELRERAELQTKYDRQIEDLQKRLDTEKDLTQTQRNIIRDIIIQTEIQRDNTLAEYDRKITEARVQRAEEERQKMIEEWRKTEEALAEVEGGEESGEDNIPTIEEVAARLGVTAEGIAYFKQLIAEGMSADEAFAATTKKVTEDNIKSFSTAMNSMSSSFSALSEALGEIGGESEQAQKAQKAFAIAGIAASQAQSIANGALAISAGIASAAATPFPANIPAIIAVVAQIATIVASVASSIKQAKQVINGASSAGNYSNGGIIPGTSYSGDRLTANVNSGEMILNKEQQSRLFDIANSGGQSFGIDYNAMAAAMATAVAAQPAPVVVYQELQDFGEGVSRAKEVAIV